jgi:DNA-binding beta-propeller fold protein YncE
MGEYRELLEQGSERFDLAPGALERMHVRRRRRDRNRRVGAGVLALVVAAGGTWLIVRAFEGIRPTPRPAEKPRIVETSSIDARPSALAVGKGAVWIASSADRTLIRLDSETGQIVEEFPLPTRVGPPIGVTFGGGAVWVKTGFVGGPPLIRPSVLQIDPATGRVLRTFTLGHSEHGEFAVVGGALWTSNPETGEVFRRDLPEGDVTTTIQAATRLVDVAIEAGPLWVLGGGRLNNQAPLEVFVARIDARTGSVTGSARLGPNPQDLEVGAGAVWVVDADRRAVWRIDPEAVTVGARIPVGGLPTQIAVTENAVWVLDWVDGTLSRIDPDRSRVTGSVRVGAGPVAVAASRDSVWVALADGTILRVLG